MTEHKYKPEPQHGSYDKEFKWPKVPIYHPQTKHNPYPFIHMCPAEKNSEGMWVPVRPPESGNAYEWISGGFICNAAPPDYRGWYANTIRDFKEHQPVPEHPLWKVVDEIQELADEKPEAIQHWLLRGIDPHSWDGYGRIVAPLKEYNDRMWKIEWEKTINSQKKPLVERLKGTEWLEPDTAKKMMETCDWRNQNRPGWREGTSIEATEIKYNGHWLVIARCDLAGQCPTTRYHLDGTAEKREVWVKSVAYGVVVTPDTWYVIDSLTDG